METVPVDVIGNVRIGNATDEKGATGCTVILCPEGAAAGLDVRGGGPASRESELLNPRAAADRIHAVLLSGGSAFGLDAAGGVMRYLEERRIGFDTGVTHVPLVCSSCIFDLSVGDFRARPDVAMGYAACVDAERNSPREGNSGAGTGASVGKLLGMDFAMKSGLGLYACREGELLVGAVACVNALGDVLEDRSSTILAGLLNPEKTGFRDSQKVFYEDSRKRRNRFTGNTTISAVITNARYGKAQMGKIAAMASNAYPRTIRPVNTSADGDSVYALSVGGIEADPDYVGTLAADVLARAIENAVVHASAAYGLPACGDILKDHFRKV